MPNFKPWVQPTKAGNFIIRYRNAEGKKKTYKQPIGKYERAVIGGKLFVGKNLANKYCDKFLEEYHQNQFGDVDLSLKCAGLVEEWMNERDSNNLSSRTQINTQARINGFLRDGGMPTLADLTRANIIKYKIAMFKQGLANNTIVGRLACLGTFLNWLVDGEKLKKNPMKERTKDQRRKGSAIMPQSTDPEPHFYTTEEYLSLLSALADDPEMQMACELAYGAGLRKVELVGDKGRDRVRWEDIHWLSDGRANIHLRKEICKGQKRDRTIPLDAGLIKLLSLPKTGWILNMTRDSMDYRFLKARRAAGINEELTPHGLRHTFAKNYLQSGRGNMKSLMDLLGHVDAKTTRIYAQFEQSYYQEGVNAAYVRRLNEESLIRKNRITLSVEGQKDDIFLKQSDIGRTAPNVNGQTNSSKTDQNIDEIDTPAMLSTDRAKSLKDAF